VATLLSKPAVMLCALGASACGEPTGASVPEFTPASVPPLTDTDFALSFDGQGQYATTATSYFPIANANQSITVWMKRHDNAGDQAVFTIRRGIESGTLLGLSGGRLTVWSVWGMRVFAQSDVIEPDRWVHVAHVQVLADEDEGSYDQRLYLDGVLVTQGTLPPQNRTPTSSWIGTFDGTGMPYAGALDDLGLYARALGDDEIEREANGNERPEADRLIASFGFDESPGSSVAYDRSGRGNHATLGDGVRDLMPQRVVSDAPKGR
jgi:hypothetical protein